MSPVVPASAGPMLVYAAASSGGGVSGAAQASGITPSCGSSRCKNIGALVVCRGPAGAAPATRVPLPWRRTIGPSSRSSSYAVSTVLRPTARAAASARSGGSGSPGARSPSSISPRSRAASNTGSGPRPADHRPRRSPSSIGFICKPIMRHWLSDRHPGPASMARYLSSGADKDRPMREFPASPITSLIDEKPRYNLGESMAADLTVADLLGPAELAGLAGVNLGYGTTAGDPALRALVAARHGIPASQVLITAGAAAALFLTALLCADGEVLVRLPCFPPVLDTLRGVGARVVTVRSRFDDGYRIDPDAFARQLSPRTQLVMVASPQNPSGVPISDSEAEQMLTAMSRACPAALLLIDET